MLIPDKINDKEDKNLPCMDIMGINVNKSLKKHSDKLKNFFIDKKLNVLMRHVSQNPEIISYKFSSQNLPFFKKLWKLGNW